MGTAGLAEWLGTRLLDGRAEGPNSVPASRGFLFLYRTDEQCWFWVSVWGYFGVGLGWCWGRFGMVWGWFGDRCGIVLGPLWVSFGTVLG